MKSSRPKLIPFSRLMTNDCTPSPRCRWQRRSARAPRAVRRADSPDGASRDPRTHARSGRGRRLRRCLRGRAPLRSAHSTCRAASPAKFASTRSGELQRRKVVAMRPPTTPADSFAAPEVEYAARGSDMPAHHCIKVAVIDDIVHVTVDVVVHPARGDGEDMRDRRFVRWDGVWIGRGHGRWFGRLRWLWGAFV